MPRASCLAIVLASLVAAIGDADPQAPSNVDALLARPATPGTIALLVEHGSFPGVQARPGSSPVGAPTRMTVTVDFQLN
jgi:hypothetical protein